MYIPRNTRFGHGALALLVMTAFTARADFWFDPALVSGDAHAVADLSQFERGGEPAGSYDVSVWLNGAGGKSRRLRFVARNDPSVAGQPASGPEGESHDDTGLVPCLTAGDLAALGVRTGAVPALSDVPPGQCISPGRFISHAWTGFDFQKMRLDISIPQAYVQGGSAAQDTTRWDEGINAALMNYRLSGSDNRARNGDSRSYFLSLNSGLNVGAWRLRDSSTWQYNDASGGRQGWQHLNTYVARDIIPWRSELTAGDSTTDGDIFDSLGFRGLQLATSEDMYPDAVHGYAPVIRGIADSNAQVRVRQSGKVIYQTSVPAGAFVISDLSPASAGGDADGDVRSGRCGAAADNADGRAAPVPAAGVSGGGREGDAQRDLQLSARVRRQGGVCPAGRLCALLSSNQIALLKQGWLRCRVPPGRSAKPDRPASYSALSA